ncbi:MAG TPA: ClbS/DfsB family four-helix bundle protein [Candidatus Dormibacteraeota bacterium]
MTEATLRDRLLQTLEAAEEHEAVLLALCDDTPAAEEGRWTAKDNIAHLNTWREHATRTLDAVRDGQTVDGPYDDSQIDGRNAEIYEAHRHDSADEVRTAAGTTYVALKAAVAACTDAELRRERPTGGELWRLVPGNGHAHVAQHVSSWLAEHGDAAGAEATALWAYTLETELFPEPADKAVADYNLACFYARNARVDEALPLLGGALRSQPDLRDWAMNDPDLTPIREDPRVQSLVGG